MGDPVTYRSAMESAVVAAAIVLGGLAATIAVAWGLYRRNVNARRRYVYLQPAPQREEELSPAR
jgi:hypothetical protein